MESGCDEHQDGRRTNSFPVQEDDFAGASEPTMNNMRCYEERIQALEDELDEMTTALSQAWDQLVPFLQEVPPQAETTRDIAPILEAVLAAADAEMAGIYLFHSDDWFSVPRLIPIDSAFSQQLRRITQEQTLDCMAPSGSKIYWALAPVRSEQTIIGVLGIGSYDQQHAFNAVHLRIIARMAERIGSQVAAAQLARSREREAVVARELQIASEIQRSIQPEEGPQTPSMRMSAYWHPASQVGGDAWGWVQQPDEQLTWFVLDVAGKGLPAALAAASLHTAIRMALHMRLSPMDVLLIVNEEFYEPYTRTDLLATVAIISFDPCTRTLELANAGHPPVLVRQGGVWQRLIATAPPVGVLPELRATPQRLRLHQGDLIICHSDGFSEIQTPSGLWGQTGLLNAIPADAQDLHALIKHIVAAAQHAGPIQDDQTLVAAMYETR